MHKDFICTFQLSWKVSVPTYSSGKEKSYFFMEATIKLTSNYGIPTGKALMKYLVGQNCFQQGDTVTDFMRL